MRKAKLLEGIVVFVALVALVGGLVAAVFADNLLNRGVAWGSNLPAIPQAVANPLGVNLFIDKEVEDWKIQKTLQMVKDGGFKYVRQEFLWSALELKKGYYWDDYSNRSTWEKYDRLVNLYNQYGLEVIARLDAPPTWARSPQDDVKTWTKGPPQNFADYGDFVYNFVSRYKGKVKYFQIWNEPNLQGEWGNYPIDPGAYTELLKTAYTRAKEANPEAVILMAGLAPTDQLGPTNLNDLLFLQGMYDHGAKNYFDIGSVMVYGLGYSPNDRRIDFDRINFSRTALTYEVMAKNGDGSKPVWASEYGWISLPVGWTGQPSIWGESIPEDKQAQYLVEGYERAQREWPWMGVMFVWAFHWVESPDATGPDPTPYFAITKYDFTPRPAYEALRQYSLRFPQAHPGYSPPESQAVSYSGQWSTGKTASGDYMVADSSGSSLVLKFAGTQVDSVVDKGSGAGRLMVEVDGKPANPLPRDNDGRASLDLRNLASGGVRITLAKDLSDGEHSLKLSVEGDGAHPGIGAFYIGRQAEFGWLFPVIYLITGLGILVLAIRAQSLVFALASYRPSLPAWGADRKNRPGEIVTFAWGQRVSSQNQTAAILLLLGLSLASFYFIDKPYLALPALGLFGLLAILRPDLAIVFAIFSIPFTFHPKQLGSSEFSLAESIVLVMAVAGIARWIIALFTRRTKEGNLGSIRSLRELILSSLSRPFVYPIILFAAVATISLLVPDRAQLKFSLREYRTVIVEPILFYLLMLGAVKTERQIWRAVDVLLILGLFVSALAVWQYFFTGTAITAEGVSRAVSLYQHPNNVGLFLGRVTAFGLCLSLFLPKSARRYGYAALTVLLVPGLALSFSRGAWLGLVGAVIVVALVTRSWRIIIPAAAVIVAGLAYLPFAKVERLTSLLTLESGSSSTRLLVWGSAIQMIKDHPIFGVGLDQFLYQYTSKYVQPEAWNERFTSHPHNLVLDYWTRLGIMGLLAGVWLLVSFFRLSLSLTRRLTEPGQRALTLSAIASITVFILHGLVDNSYFLPDLAMLFWFCLAIVSILDRLANIQPALSINANQQGREELP